MTAREAMAKVFEDVDGSLAMTDVLARVRALPGGDRWTDASQKTLRMPGPLADSAPSLISTFERA